MPRAWLILPTYNEAENIEAIVAAALPQLASTGLEHRILIVDDGSPDGTGAIADRLAAENETVEVLHRPGKGGLGPAYLAGFERALAGGADLVLEMDSDFSHDPADLPRLIAAAGDADLVLGSRYVPGGGVTDWGFVRRLVSRGGSAYARIVLGVPVRDLTGGFKCFRRACSRRSTSATCTPTATPSRSSSPTAPSSAGFSVTEVPIVFRNRLKGESKMTPDIALEAAWMVPFLRFRS